ncbi:MAG: hypothetical protein GIW95_06335 [Candidatus Eremiobacteraeota bacterium]|nr:hypothetical protein [Candidatus Eremiobacteraeota bacterium]
MLFRRFSVRRPLGVLAGLGLAAGFAACSSKPLATPAAQFVAVGFSIPVPGRVASSLRGRMAVPPGTQSALVSAASGGQTVASALVNCTATCSGTLSLLPATYTFTVSLFAAANGGGALLASGSAPQTIGGGQSSTTISFAFGGQIAKISLVLEPSSVPAGKSSTVQLFVEAEDANGNLIVGSDNYTMPVTLTTSDSTNAALSTTTVAAPGAPVTVTYSGAAITSIGFTANASGAKAATTSLSVNGASPPPQTVGGVADPVPVPPLRPPGPSPKPTTTPAPTAIPIASPTAVPVAALPGAAALSQFSGTGAATFGRINGGARQATVAIGSQLNVESTTPTQLNFQLSVANGLATFDARRSLGGQLGKTVIDLGAHRSYRSAFPPDYHAQSRLDRSRSLGRGTADVRRKLAVPTVGTQRTFFISGVGASYTLRAITANNRVAIWTADSLTDVTPALSQLVTMTQNATAAIDAAIGTAAYPPNAPGIQQFTTCDTSGAVNGSGAAVVPDPGYVNEVFYDGAVGGSSGAALGFFAPNDFTPRAIDNCSPPLGRSTSNEGPFSFVRWTGSSAASLVVMQGTITHEWAHLVGYVQKSIVQAGNFDLGWLLEGLGSLVEDYTSSIGLAQGAANLGNPTGPIYDPDNAMRIAADFLSAPQNFSLTGFGGQVNGQFQAGGATNYGLSYLFLKYLVDRYGNGLVKELHTTTDRGATNIINAVGRRCSCTVTFAQLFADFATMLAVSNTGVTTDPRYNLQSFSLRQTYTSSVTGQSVTFSGPATIGTLAPGQTVEVQRMYQNGFAYFGFNNFAAAGSTIRLDDLSGGALNLMGAIGQL